MHSKILTRDQVDKAIDLMCGATDRDFTAITFMQDILMHGRLSDFDFLTYYIAMLNVLHPCQIKFKVVMSGDILKYGMSHENIFVVKACL